MNKYFKWVKSVKPNYKYSDYYNVVKKYKRLNEKLKKEGLKQINPFYEAYVSITYEGNSIYERARQQSLNKTIEKNLTKLKLENFINANPELTDYFNAYMNDKITLKELKEIIEKYKKSPKYLAVGS